VKVHFNIAEIFIAFTFQCLFTARRVHWQITLKHTILHATLENIRKPIINATQLAADGDVFPSNKVVVIAPSLMSHRWSSTFASIAPVYDRDL
jgi:hypothetical protein